VALVALVLSVSVAATLYAHQTMLRSSPAKDEQVAVQPTQLELVFREPIQATFTRVTLLGPESLPVPLGELQVEGDSATIASLAIPRPLSAGPHTVQWRTTGADGHAVSGHYRFEVLASAVPTVTQPPTDSGGTSGVVPFQAAGQGPLLGVGDWPYALIRWLGFASLLGVLGAAFFGLVVLPAYGRAATEDGSGALMVNTASFGRSAALLLLLAGAGRLVAQGMTMLDVTEQVTVGWIVALLTGTVWGHGWLLQMVAAAAARMGFGAAARTPGRPRWMLALAGALALSVTPALSGHAIATPGPTVLAVAADTVHILAAGGWMGGLAVLLLVGLPTIHRATTGDKPAAVAQMVQAFSRPALVLGGLVALTGLVGAWLHLERIADLWSTSYGQTLTLKLVMVGLLFGLGALNFLRVGPALGSEAGTRRLRRSAGSELTVGILVLLVTAFLVALPPSAAPMDPMQDLEPIVLPSTTQPQD